MAGGKSPIFEPYVSEGQVRTEKDLEKSGRALPIECHHIASFHNNGRANLLVAGEVDGVRSGSTIKCHRAAATALHGGQDSVKRHFRATTRRAIAHHAIGRAYLCPAHTYKHQTE